MNVAQGKMRLSAHGGGSGSRVDHLGDPLPEGAIQRLGTRRMQYSLREATYSADGSLAYAISGEELHVWDLARGERVGVYAVSGHRLTAMGCNRCVGKALLADASGAVVEWNLSDHCEVRRFQTGRSAIASIHYSPDEARMLTLDGAAATTEEWDLASGNRLVAIAVEEERFGHCCYAPDGKTAYVAHSPGHNVYHFDLGTGDLIRKFVEDYVCYDMCLSADGERLFVGTRHKSNEWRLADYECLETFTGHHGHAVPSVAYTRDERRLLTGSRDGSIRLWDRHTAEVVRRWFPHRAHVSRMRVSPDGKWVLSYGNDHLLIETSLETGTPRLPWERHLSAVTAVVFSPDGSVCVTGSMDNTIRIWDAGTWMTSRTIENPGTEVTGLAISADGAHLAAASKDGTVGIFDLETGGLSLTLPGHRGYARAVAFCGDRVVSAGDDGIVAVWDLAKGEAVHSMAGHVGGILALSVRGDGERALSGGRDGTVREWGLGDGRELTTIQAHRGAVEAVDYAGDGQHALSVGRDGAVVEWDLQAGIDVLCLEQDDWIESAVFAGDGIFCTAGRGGDIRVWNRGMGLEAGRLLGHEGAVHALAVSPDGRTLVSGSADSTALVWSLSD